MTGTISVIPAEGARVRQPERFGEPVPATGALVPDNSYYRRFVIAGDLIEAPLTETPADPTPPSPAAEEPPRRRREPTPSPTTDQE